MRLGLFLVVVFLAAFMLSTVGRAQTPGDECACISCNLDTQGPPTATTLDYAVFLGALGKSTKDDKYSPRADFDRSGTVTLLDWATMLKCCPLSSN